MLLDAGITRGRGNVKALRLVHDVGSIVAEREPTGTMFCMESEENLGSLLGGIDFDLSVCGAGKITTVWRESQVANATTIRWQYDTIFRLQIQETKYVGVPESDQVAVGRYGDGSWPSRSITAAHIGESLHMCLRFRIPDIHVRTGKRRYLMAIW